MNATLETLNPTWDDARDGAFFRLVADALPADLVAAGTVLLASYDDDNDDDYDQDAFQGAGRGATLAR